MGDTQSQDRSHEMLGGLLFIAVALLSALALVLIVHFAAGQSPQEATNIQCGGAK